MHEEIIAALEMLKEKEIGLVELLQKRIVEKAAEYYGKSRAAPCENGYHTEAKPCKGAIQTTNFLSDNSESNIKK